MLDVCPTRVIINHFHFLTNVSFHGGLTVSVRVKQGCFLLKQAASVQLCKVQLSQVLLCQ